MTTYEGIDCQEWRYLEGLRLEEVEAALIRGEIAYTDQFWMEGMQQWDFISEKWPEPVKKTEESCFIESFMKFVGLGCLGVIVTFVGLILGTAFILGHVDSFFGFLLIVIFWILAIKFAIFVWPIILVTLGIGAATAISLDVADAIVQGAPELSAKTKAWWKSLTLQQQRLIIKGSGAAAKGIVKAVAKAYIGSHSDT